MRRYTAELIGTFVLAFGGVGTAVLCGYEVGYLGVAFAFGLTLLIMAYAIGPVSGCHINPAVTVGFLVVRKVRPRDAAGRRRVRRHPHRADTDTDPPDLDPGRQHQRQPGPQHRTRPVRRHRPALSQLWVFIVMSLVGGIIGALAYRALFTGAPAVATETSAVATESSTGRQRRHGERSRR